MRKLVISVSRFVREDFHPGLYVTVAIFLALSIWANYQWNIDREVIDSYNRTWAKLPIYVGFYSLAYLIPLFAWAYFTQNWQHLSKRGFWIAVAFGITLLSVNSWFHYYQPLVRLFFEGPAVYWAYKIFWYISQSSLYLISLVIFWVAVAKRDGESFYGFTTKGFDPKPYLLMLLMLSPLMFWASFQDDFMQTYPSYRPGPVEAATGWSPLLTTATAQFFYGLNFTFVELFFRGFLVIGMIRWLGRGAVLPMVVLYCFLHFGKPAGEAIGAIAGGYILGILAFQTRTILGGVIAHWGVAWLMEGAAYLQLYLLSPD